MSEDDRAELHWRKSTRSGSDNCVIVAITEDQVHVRDSQSPDGPTLSFGPQAWTSFVDAIHAGGVQRSDHDTCD